MENNTENMEFLQSEQWSKFQEAAGRKAYKVSSSCSSPLGRGCHEVAGEGGVAFSASLIEHSLPIVGKYWYCPRGPIMKVKSQKSKVKSFLGELVELAKKENAGWIRIEPESEEILKVMKENVSEKIFKAPHDVQPKEIFVLDISKPSEQLLAEMKPKTRYNIGVAKKKGVVIASSQKSKIESKKYAEEFLKLTEEMAERQGIIAHPAEYYRKMIETLPDEMLKIYVAEFEGKIIAANLVLFFGNTATYLHGASGNSHRNLMAPFLLQWQAMLDAKEMGFARYDFGGVKTNGPSSWEGITNFKLGFSPHTKHIVFPGSYDVVVNSRAYMIYRGLQRAKALIKTFRR